MKHGECPRCDPPVALVDAGADGSRTCPGCGGMQLSPVGTRGLLDAARMGRAMYATLLRATTDRSLTCPTCLGRLARANLAYPVFGCERCGHTWTDAGVLHGASDGKLGAPRQDGRPPEVPAPPPSGAAPVIHVSAWEGHVDQLEHGRRALWRRLRSMALVLGACAAAWVLQAEIRFRCPEGRSIARSGSALDAVVRCDVGGGVELVEVHADGWLRLSERFLDGKRHGRAVAYQSRGVLLHAGTFAGGRKDGIWTTYHPNGMLATRGDWQEGRRRGVHARWGADGSLVDEVTWTPGVVAPPPAPARSTDGGPR